MKHLRAKLIMVDRDDGKPLIEGAVCLTCQPEAAQ